MNSDKTLSQNYNKIPKKIIMPDEHYIKIYETLKKINHSGIILDYGCGNGYLIKHIKKKYHCEGYDFAEELINNAKILNPGIEFFTNRELLTKKYDIIILSEVLEHFSNPFNELLFISSLLNKNGKLIITTPNFNRINIGKILFNKKKFQPMDDIFYSPQEINFMLKFLNYRIIFFENFGNYLPNYSKLVIFRLLLDVINKIYSFMNLNFMQKKNNLYVFQKEENMNFAKGFKDLLN